MNLWTGVALANLQRHRGPPLDMDIETGEIASPDLVQCKGPCGQWKEPTEFYLKHDARTGTHRRQSTCKECICARDIARRPKNPRKPRPYQAMLDFMAAEPKTLREIYEALDLSRRVAQRMIYVLTEDGLVVKSGKSGINRDPQNPPLYKTTPKQLEATP
jgi:hypothetical protein